jgi:hypothetical protein
MSTADALPFPIYDYQDGYVEEHATRDNTEPLPESFGRNLDTLEKARLWLTNPHNWHSSHLFILKWNGLIPTVDAEHGRRLIAEPWDDGLPWAAVYGQMEVRSGRRPTAEPELRELTEAELAEVLESSPSPSPSGP